MFRALKVMICTSIFGLSAGMLMSSHIGFFTGLTGPLLVLFFFLVSAASITGLAIIKTRRERLRPDQPTADYQH